MTLEQARAAGLMLAEGILHIDEEIAAKAVALLWCLYAAGHIPPQHAAQAWAILTAAGVDDSDLAAMQAAIEVAKGRRPQ